MIVSNKLIKKCNYIPLSYYIESTHHYHYHYHYQHHRTSLFFGRGQNKRTFLITRPQRVWYCTSANQLSGIPVSVQCSIFYCTNDLRNFVVPNIIFSRTQRQTPC